MIFPFKALACTKCIDDHQRAHKSCGLGGGRGLYTYVGLSPVLSHFQSALRVVSEAQDVLHTSLDQSMCLSLKQVVDEYSHRLHEPKRAYSSAQDRYEVFIVLLVLYISFVLLVLYISFF